MQPYSGGGGGGGGGGSRGFIMVLFKCVICLYYSPCSVQVDSDGDGLME